MKIIRWIFQPLLYHVAAIILAKSHQPGTEYCLLSWYTRPAAEVRSTYLWVSSGAALILFLGIPLRTCQPDSTEYCTPHNIISTVSQVVRYYSISRSYRRLQATRTAFLPAISVAVNFYPCGESAFDISVIPNHRFPVLRPPRLQLRRSLSWIGVIFTNPAIRNLLPVQWRFTWKNIMLRWNTPSCYGSATYISCLPTFFLISKLAVPLLPRW